MLVFYNEQKKTVESQQQWQPSWISVRLGRLGMNKAILVSSHATAGSQKNRFILGVVHTWCPGTVPGYGA